MTAIDLRITDGPSSTNHSTAELLSPERRVPTPMLIALDDDSETEGEVLRLRKTETTLGRRHADWCFANDADISSLHAKILRTGDDHGGCVWQLVDQQSTNGTYVRKTSIPLTAEDSFMIGGLGFRWERSQGTSPQFQMTEIGGSSHAIPINSGNRLRIGRDETSAEIHLDHRTIDPIHAALRETSRGWLLEDQHSRNGIWHRVTSFTLCSGSTFILGEQRFVFRLPNDAAGSFRQRGMMP
ncbi:Forkhead-associated domain protein [Rhodopirellula maiorica SM1]|uniref:Forkhead-associated domain protein n=2 Tax=Novipirellula TaxID=2795426 RepID=M5RVS0_9BACT|nr:Forkhead-associated domain protein [Rhodopirellula maiorica SM1]